MKPKEIDTDFKEIIKKNLEYVHALGTMYKYISASSGILLLEHKSLKFNIPENFNDPFDCDPTLITTSNKYNIEVLKKLVKNPAPDLNRLIILEMKDLIAKGDFNNSRYYSSFRKDSVEMLRKGWLVNTKVTCFSEEYNNMLLWSHYAKDPLNGKNHTGICIAFNTHNFILSLADTLTSLKLQGQFLKVKYDTKRNNIIVNSREEVPAQLANWLKVKSSCWEYENEIRLVFPGWSVPLDISILPISDNVISAVYLGLQISKSDENHIREVCAKNFPAARIFKMRLSETDYALLANRI